MSPPRSRRRRGGRWPLTPPANGGGTIPAPPLDEYDGWVYAELEPRMLAGMGVPAGWRRLSVVQRDALDDIHVGLAEGAALRRQRAA